MPLDLNSAIADPPTADQAAMLNDLQPNILKPHTREFLAILFLQFLDKAAGRRFLSQLRSVMKSASVHLAEIAQFKASQIPGSAYVGCGLTAAGYGVLGVDKARMPPDASFARGMQGEPRLHDPLVSTWDPAFQDAMKLHACVLVGDMSMAGKSAAHAQVLALVAAVPGVVVLGTQDGVGQHNSNGDGIEHFGYVDGRSQPLFFDEDIRAEMASTDGISNWDPRFPIGQAIVADSAAPGPSPGFGSYFVFRKLEQDVKAFKTAELKFADDVGLEDAELAGGMLVGRFEDGTAVTMQKAEGTHNPVANSFNYDSDRAGGKCPFMGHIRKTNPRGSGLAEPHALERAHLMPRRGQTYGVRTDNPNDGQLDNKPTQHVGLLFMAFNSDIGNQFEFTQIHWANAPGFPGHPLGTKAPGVDPIIGQTPNDGPRPQMTVPVNWGDSKSVKTVAPLPRTVTMKGGDYFFMPSLGFLASLAPGHTAT